MMRTLIIEDAPDLDAPNRTIRRARVVDPLRLLRLTDREWAAAEPEELRDNTLFIGFAPLDDPKIALAVMAENSKLASDVARKVMDFYLLPKATPVAPKTEEKPSNEIDNQ